MFTTYIIAQEEVDFEKNSNAQYQTTIEQIILRNLKNLQGDFYELQKRNIELQKQYERARSEATIAQNNYHNAVNQNNRLRSQLNKKKERSCLLI